MRNPSSRTGNIRSGASLPFVLTAALWAWSSVLVAEDAPQPDRALVKPGHCVSVSEDLVGRRAHGLDADVEPPKKLRGTRPDYPSRSASEVGSGMWLGEALIGVDGSVRGLWAIREPQFTPPWPEFSDAIADSIRESEYSPAMLDAEPVPVCVVVTVSINWR